jgi:hypothetical protein
MSARIIHIPLSGGDRKAQAKGIRYAHGIHNSYFKESVLIRSAAEAKIREADQLECERGMECDHVGRGPGDALRPVNRRRSRQSRRPSTVAMTCASEPTGRAGHARGFLRCDPPTRRDSAGNVAGDDGASAITFDDADRRRARSGSASDVKMRLRPCLIPTRSKVTK